MPAPTRRPELAQRRTGTSRTSTPRCAIERFTSLIRSSPKWKIDAASTADAHVLLHSTAARAVSGSVNRVGIAVDDFHRLLGIACGRHLVEATRRRDAARNPVQLKNAAAEVGRGPLVKAGVAGLILGAVALAKNAKKRGCTGR